MRISDVMKAKGADVATVGPAETVGGLIALLAWRNVGAMVVVEGDEVVGIVSERDVVRQLHARGPDLLRVQVSDIMTKDVVSCSPDDTVDSLAATMTQLRVRHMPVLVDGKLAGIVSIGDVVKSRMSELESDREQLESYIAQG
jgi:CBS domain-containing protein